ncbi:MAG TPA: S1 family peptidase [Polyangiaceae bacterium]|nr:S1 family peptidase [Polyangiaceae bacterium]
MGTDAADARSRKLGAPPSRAGQTCAFALKFGLILCSGALLGGCLQLPHAHARTPQAASGDATPAEDANIGLPLALATDEDYVVRVVSGSVTCTGSLIEEDRVLTAHHCLSQRGRSGNMLELDVAPETVRVELGGDPFAWGEVGVRAVIAPTCGYSGGEGDIAVLVLERKLIGVPTRKVELGNPPQVGTPIEPIGFGRCFFGGSAGARTVRNGGPIQKVWKRDFRVEASICPGDSGGPAVDQSSGAILGVISEAVMDGDPETRGEAEFTRLDAWSPLFTQAQAVVDGMSQAELPPVECR